MTRIERLNRIGLRLLADERVVCAEFADLLRTIHRRERRHDPEDYLLELADDLDTLASPIVVTRPRGTR